MNARKRIAIGVATFALAGGATAGGAIGGGVAMAGGDSGGSGSITATGAARHSAVKQAEDHDARTGTDGSSSVTARRAPSNCPRGFLCVYPKANYKGQVKKVAQNNRNLERYGGAFDTPYSAYNNGASCNVVVYEDTNYHGTHYKLNRGTGWKYIGYNLLNIYSNKWVNCS